MRNNRGTINIFNSSMKNSRLILAFFLVFWGTNTIKSQDLCGEYVSTIGDKVIIDQDYFYYIYPMSFASPYYTDTLAKCSINYINENLIELNSVGFPFFDVFKDCKITQAHDTTLRDERVFKFQLPHYKRKLGLRIGVEQKEAGIINFNTPHFIYSDTVNSIKLPEKGCSFDFTIAQEGGPSPHTPEGTFYGLLYVCSPDYTISPSCNSITIELPSLTDYFFEQYYVKGEYARVKGKSIIWKGITYKKTKRKNKTNHE